MSARRAPAAQRKAPAAREASPKLLLVGKGSGASGVHSALSELEVIRVWLSSLDELDEAVGRGAVALVWSCIGIERGFGRSMVQIREQFAEGPVFAVVGDDAREAVVRGLYRAGISGVFAWPREGLLLARYVAEMLSLRRIRGPAAGADVALARSVRAHLRHLPQAGGSIRVDVEDGSVLLGGSIGTLAARDEMERRVEMIPGVASLDCAKVQVDAIPVADSAIRDACRRIVRTECEERTVSVSVRGGRVRFAGSVPDVRIARRIRELAAYVAGVREVDVAIDVSPREAKRDRGALRRLRALLESLFADAEFTLAYHGGVAVLDGTVATLRSKRAMQRVLEQDSSVLRVVNKLDVSR